MLNTEIILLTSGRNNKKYWGEGVRGNGVKLPFQPQSIKKVVKLPSLDPKRLTTLWLLNFVQNII